MPGSDQTKLPFYHVEDEEDWRTVIESLIEHSTGFDYIYVDGNIDQVSKLLMSVNGPGVVLFDLHLEDDSQSELYTIARLSTLVDILKNKDVDILILSGYLPEYGRPKLLSYGVLEENIYSKGIGFTQRRKEFIDKLNYIENQKKSQKLLTNDSSYEERANPLVCDIEVEFSDLDQIEDSIPIVINREYKLSITIRTTKDLADEIEGEKIGFFLYGDGFEIAPQKIDLELSPINVNQTQILKIKPRIEFENLRQRLLILAYHNYHLIRQMAFDFDFLPNGEN